MLGTIIYFFSYHRGKTKGVTLFHTKAKPTDTDSSHPSVGVVVAKMISVNIQYYIYYGF